MLLLYPLLHIGIGWILGIIFYVGAELRGQIEFLLWIIKIIDSPDFPGKNIPTSAGFVNVHLIDRNRGNPEAEYINKHHRFYCHQAEEGEQSRFEWFIFVRITGVLNISHLTSVLTS